MLQIPDLDLNIFMFLDERDLVQIRQVSPIHRNILLEIQESLADMFIQEKYKYNYSVHQNTLTLRKENHGCSFSKIPKKVEMLQYIKSISTPRILMV